MEQKKDTVQVLKRVFCILLALFVVFSAVGIGCYLKLNRMYDGAIPVVVRPDGTVEFDPAPTPDPFAAALDTTKDYYETGEIQEVPIYKQEQIDRFIFSMLVLVQNGNLNTENPQTDMMFIVSYSQIRQTFTVVSLMRDMLVPMGEDGWKRLNAAYARGGVGQLINTVNDLFGLDIQNYVYTGTEELASLADLIGGIRVELTEEEAAYVNNACASSLSAGAQTLTGEQAIVHLGDRTSDGTGDFGRSARQLSMIENTFHALRENHDRTQMVAIFTSIFQNIRTNIPFDTLAGIGYEMCLAEDLAVVTSRVPFDDSYTETSMDGAFALIPELKKNEILLMQTLYSKE